MDKFGRIFMENRVDGASELAFLPSVRFSNYDHKFYNSDNQIHSEFEKYRGRTFFMRFNIEQNDKNGVLVPFEGNINLTYTLGEIEQQDFESIVTVENEDFELVRHHKLIPKEVKVEKNLREIEQAALLAACFQGCKLSESKIFRIFNLAFFAFDDHMEEIGATVKYDEQFKLFVKLTVDIIDGKIVNLEELNQLQQKMPDELFKYIKFIQYFHEELSKAEGGIGRAFFVRETFKEFVQGVCFESSCEWKKQPASLFDRAKKDLRLVVAGAYICLEMALFDADIQVKPEIRNTFLFKSFVKLYAQQTCWINDVISYRKEMKAGQSGGSCNKVYLLHYNKGLPLKIAMQKVLDKANQHTTRIVETGRLLKELYVEDEGVQRLVKKTNDIVYGHIQWITFSDRYHKGLVFDCVLGKA